MTTELFREDAYLKTCNATIVSTSDEGIVLDETIFYPEGGGQPGDSGILSSPDGRALTVVDTRKNAAGLIVHVVDGVPGNLAIGTVMQATVDWQRRYHHMRTHTCLHLLCSLVPFPVTGGSISVEKGRLDFDMVETIDKESVQEQIQRLVDANYSVGMRWISDEEMSTQMDLVRTMSVAPPMGQSKVRLIDVQGIDLQPCGGTHVAATGEIGEVRIGKVEKKGKHNRRINLHLST